MEIITDEECGKNGKKLKGSKGRGKTGLKWRIHNRSLMISRELKGIKHRASRYEVRIVTNLIFEINTK